MSGLDALWDSMPGKGPLGAVLARALPAAERTDPGEGQALAARGPPCAVGFGRTGHRPAPVLTQFFCHVLCDAGILMDWDRPAPRFALLSLRATTQGEA